MFDLIDHLNTGPKSELVYEVPMTTWSPYSYHIAYRIKISDLRKNDLIVCGANAEATSEHAYNVMICTYIVLTRSKYDVEGQIVCPAYGGNVTRNEHHRPIYTGGSAIVDSDDYKYISLVIYTASTAALPDDKIKIENGYGRMYILHYRQRKPKEGSL